MAGKEYISALGYNKLMDFIQEQDIKSSGYVSVFFGFFVLIISVVGRYFLSFGLLPNQENFILIDFLAIFLAIYSVLLAIKAIRKNKKTLIFSAIIIFGGIVFVTALLYTLILHFYLIYHSGASALL